MCVGGGGVSRKMRCVCVCVCVCACMRALHAYRYECQFCLLAFCDMNCLQSLLLSFSAYMFQGG